jgi:hypothetical protein
MQLIPSFIFGGWCRDRYRCCSSSSSCVKVSGDADTCKTGVICIGDLCVDLSGVAALLIHPTWMGFYWHDPSISPLDEAAGWAFRSRW